MTHAGKCPFCGYQNRDGVLFCEDCAYPLTGSPDETAKESEIEQAANHFRRSTSAIDRFSRDATILLHIRNQAEPLQVELGDTQVIVGRLDKATGRKVDVDLTRYGALKTGVSRVHARFFRGEDDTLYLADAGSANGTFLNGHQIPAYEPVPVNNGDEIMLGKLRMHIYFNNPALTATNS